MPPLSPDATGSEAALDGGGPPARRPQGDGAGAIGAADWLRIVAVMERLAASRDLKEILSLIVDSMRDLLHADRASVLEYDAEKHELFATTAHGVDASLRFSADAGLAGEAVRTKRIINVPDCYADDRFNREIDRRTGYQTRCMLTVPLVSLDGRIEGVAQVLNKREDLSADYADCADSEGEGGGAERGGAEDAQRAQRRAGGGGYGGDESSADCAEFADSERRDGVEAHRAGDVPGAGSLAPSAGTGTRQALPSNPPSPASPAPLRETSPESSSPNLRNLRNLRITPPGFDARDEMIARALASQAAVAIRRAKLIEAEKRKEKMEADLRIAREIQRASLPGSLPSIDGWDLAAATTPAEETGGDAYDVMLLPAGARQTLRATTASAAGGPRVMLVMADAAGHGVGPALSVAQAMAMIRTAAVGGAELLEIVARANRLLHEAMPIGRFVAAAVGVLDAQAGVFEYVSAGLAPLLVVRADGAVEERCANAAPLGVDSELDVEPAEPVRLGPGEALAILSDGYIERLNDGRQQWGAAALREVLAANRRETAAAMLAALERAAAAHAGGREPDDDRTAVIVKRNAEG